MLQETRLKESSSISTARPLNGQKIDGRLLFIALAVVTMILYFVPFVVLGNNSYITIHDTLDGEFVESYLLVATGKALTFDGGATINNIMNGLPRTTLPSGLNVSVLLFYLFPPVWAYIVNYILVHVIAFSGMFLLLRKHFLTDPGSYGIAVAVSLCFFLVPFYSIYGLSVAGQPLLAYAFLNIRNGESNWKNYAIIFLFPLWSDIALTAPFIMTIAILILGIDWVRFRSLNRRFLVATVLFAAAYLVIQFQLIYSVLGSNKWVSHRAAWNRWTNLDLMSNIKSAGELLLTTQYHTGSFVTLPIILAACGAFGLLIARRRRAGVLDMIAIGIALITLEYGLYDWIVLWFGRFIPALRSFNAGRFYCLLPPLWMLLFALSLKELKRGKWGTLVVWCLILIQVPAIMKFDTELKNNAKLLAGRHVYEPNFRRFFAQDLFAQIDQFIGRPKNSYRVVSIGMHPSIAQFNGFYTLDGYLSNYPLSYKLQFRKIIARELDQDATLRQYFDGWGNRCYMFSSELGEDSLHGGGDFRVLHHLQIDTDSLRAMGGEYVISAAEIENSAQRGLRFEKEFSSSDSFWHIYLYSVLPSASTHIAGPDAGVRLRTEPLMRLPAVDGAARISLEVETESMDSYSQKDI
ncbi:MAG TPA: DUF6044 family protein [Terracidiphilus sp.]|nr:DUF6044 family protein [Terracidiphilus sp.]